ncbi:MAG: transporter [Marmoricola sp.]|nr:transporter [Marmoricola sp.]
MSLIIEGLEVQYGRRVALTGASLRVEPGEVTSIVGPNGAGKSTLLNCTAGLIKPARGSILVGGNDVSRVPAERVFRSGLVLVPEGKHVFSSLSVEENMRLAAASFGRAGRTARIERCLDLFPQLQTRLAQRACSLSGGEQQQLMIARSLVGEPQFVLLDEPSMGLAPQVVQGVFAILRRLADQGVGVLLVEQFVQQAVSISDHVHVLARGRLGPRMTGTEARESIDRGTFFEAYSGRQHGLDEGMASVSTDTMGERQ